MRKVRVEISQKTIFFIAIFLALLWILFQIREVIILLFVAVTLVSALFPLVERLTKLKIPKVLAIAFVYIVVISIIAGLVTLVITPLYEQTLNLIVSLPGLYQKLLPSGFVNQQLIDQQVSHISSNALTITLDFFGNFLAIITIAVLTFYLLLERDHLNRLIAQFFIGHEDRIRRISDQIEDKLGDWVRGQLLLSFVIGGTVFIMLTLLSITFAIHLAILAGFLEILPVIGPIISAIPGILIALTISPLMALFVTLGYFVIQQSEAHFIVPQLMKKAVGLNPLIVILAIAIGGKLLGISGALIAVPATVVIQIITEDILREEKQ